MAIPFFELEFFTQKIKKLKKKEKHKENEKKKQNLKKKKKWRFSL